MEDFEREIKVLVVGNGGVGKTSMIKRLCRSTFTEDYKKTIGVDFLERSLYVPVLGEDVRLLCWDTAGQEEFDSLTRAYYRGAGAAVVAFSTTDRESFDAVPSWVRKVTAECGDVAMALVQNKVDLLDRAAVSSEEAEEMARRLGLRFYRACVKEGLNVAEVFEYLAELHDRKLAAGHIDAAPAVQDLMPVAVEAVASVSNGRATAGGGGSGGEPTVVVEVVAAASGPGASAVAVSGKGPLSRGMAGSKSRGSSSSGGVPAAGGMPATVELQPSKRRGRTTLGQRVRKSAGKVGQCYG